MICKVFCIFSVVCVCKLIWVVWIVGFIYVLGFVVVVDGIFYDLDDIYYIVMCKFDISY